MDSGDRFPTQQLHQLIVDDLDNLLSGRDRLQDLFLQGLLLNPVQELPGHLEVHIRFKEDPPDFTETLPNHGLSEESPLPKLGEYTVQLVAQVVEHDSRGSAVLRRSPLPGNRQSLIS